MQDVTASLKPGRAAGSGHRWLGGSLRFALLGLLSVVIGCGQSTPTMPDSATSPGIEARRGRVPSSTDLKAIEEAEKARIDRAKQASQATYDSLKVVWQRFLDGGARLDGAFVVCDPLQYVGTVKIVGSEGADIDFGPHKLSIPRGALAAPTVITAEALVSLTVEAKFSPHGTTFAVPPKLRLSYKHCYVSSAFATRSIVYVTPELQILEWLASVDQGDAQVVLADLWHFSKYAVAYNR